MSTNPLTHPDSHPSGSDAYSHPPDPLLDEVRDIRRRVFEEHGNDMRTHVEALRKIQQEWDGPIISDRGGPAKRAG